MLPRFTTRAAAARIALSVAALLAARSASSQLFSDFRVQAPYLRDPEIGSMEVIRKAWREGPVLVLDPGGHTAAVHRVVVSPGGGELISVGNDKVVRVWNLASGAQERTLRAEIGPGFEGTLQGAALSPDQSVLAVAGYSPRQQTTIVLFDWRTGQVRHTLQGHKDAIMCLAFSRDGRTLASASYDHTVQLWDWESGKSRAMLQGHTGAVSSLSFSPDGRLLATSSQDRTIRIWDTATGEPRRVLSGHTEAVNEVAWSPSGATVASASDDGSVHFWSWQAGTILRSLPVQKDEVNCLAFSPDGRLLATGTGGPTPAPGVVQLWDAATGRSAGEPKRHAGWVTSVAFHPHGRSLVSADHFGTLTAHTLSTGQSRTMKGTGAPAYAVAWSADGARVAWSSKLAPPGSVNAQSAPDHVFNLAAPSPETAARGAGGWRRSVTQHAGRSLGVSKNGLELQVRERGAVVASRRHRKETDYDRIHCMTFTPSGEMIAGAEFTLSMYDPTGKRLREFVGHTGRVTAVSVSPDGRYLASSSADQTVRIWPLRTPPSAGEAEVTAPLLSLFQATNDSWVAWTQEGYFAASPKGERAIGWHVNRGPDRAAEYYSGYQFRRQFYRPEAIARVLEAGSVAGALRLSGEGISEAAAPRVDQIAPPRVELFNPARGAVSPVGEVELSGRISDPNGRRIAEVRTLVNGRVTPSDLPQGPASLVEWKQRVRLEPGENVVEVVALNDAGSEGHGRGLRILHQPQQAAPRPNLYLLSVGVSDYKDPNLTLRYSAKDARDFAQVWQGQSGLLFGKVVPRVLTDAQAERTAIEDSLDWLSREVTSNDWAVVFLSGHGMTDPQQQYYFAPHGAVPDRLRSSAILWSTFETTLRNLAARKVLLVVDTCHAGAIGGEPVRRRGIYNEVLRDATDTDAGLITFAACLPHESSLEKDDWDNGAFTRALVEALRGKADRGEGQDGVVTLVEASAYVANRVKELTGGRQHPVMESPASVRSSLPLAIVSEGAGR